MRYHVIKVKLHEKSGNELASFLEKKSRRVWERPGASFLEKNPDFFPEYIVMNFKKQFFLGNE